MTENKLMLDRNLLVCFQVRVWGQLAREYEHLTSHFCGRVLSINDDELRDGKHILSNFSGRNIYFCGDAAQIHGLVETATAKVHLVRELCSNVDEQSDRFSCVGLGEVPLNLHNLAVYYRDCLGSKKNNYFERLQAKHTFQALTESNKAGTSFRKGVYLSEVESNGVLSKFNLLRCSSNLGGPTLAFAEEDREIVAKVNNIANENFESRPNLNHVLAQVYENSVTVDDANRVSKEHKAKIKSHADKTKDMPANGIIAFCTFYSPDIESYKPSADDHFDRCYKNGSVLTRILFKLKEDAVSEGQLQPLQCPSDFHVTLYPDSVLLVPLSTNRLYTHEIVPPVLPVGKFPTRLGYVVRCSKTKAVFRNGATFVQRSDGTEVKLVDPKNGEVEELKELYRRENLEVEKVEYRDFDFSLNQGDYLEPRVG